MTPLVILGGSGYIGSAFRRFFDQHGIACHNLRRADLDYTQPAVLAAFLREHRPPFLINCAGYTGRPNVDACELHKTECLFANAVLPGIIRDACELSDTPWGHVSSGCIYTGCRRDGTGFTETDLPNFSFRQNNCSFYSGTKALGEELLADAPSCFIWRLRIPFNEVAAPRNYLSKLMDYECLLDVRNSLSQLDEAIAAAVACWQRHLPFGTYNLTNPGSVTTHEVVALIQQTGVCNKQFKFFRDEADFMQRAARTPRSNCVLDTAKLQAAGIHLTEIHDAITVALRNWRSAA